MSKQITAHLMGGLGNQMFQYAAARAIACKNNVPLFLDDHTGFVRDIVFKRKYELNNFPIRAEIAGKNKTIPYWTEKINRKITGPPNRAIRKGFFGTTIEELQLNFCPDVCNYEVTGNTWMHGYWQSEKYFEDIKEFIVDELMPKEPRDQKFLETAKKMQSCNSISLGVRLFEEVPGLSKEGASGITPMSFYNDAAKRMSAKINNPEFFIFCTINSPELETLDLPGKINLITHDNGYHGTLARLWLISQCKNHIISNSSFYWWGAWLSEAQNQRSNIIASPIFSNIDTIPQRWL